MINFKRVTVPIISSKIIELLSYSSWVDIWEVLSKECREEVILVDCEDLIDTLDNYLRKHR